ncbi:MAG: transcriptional regulator [Dolichospermum sp. LBC05a]|jgi:HTH-type transcriptional regulator/antitoxin HigA|nr:transcriptional regulator [Dolichospermum sp. OL01]MCO5798591.1 transcriptional regulator [Dolichospermum sp. OL03]MCS6279298.1 transcriptional regulator [Dolichospermum sp.]OBQ33970.1 MAG: transcriptional regulator [Anabaena sp. MDT14b]QSV60023.1 MAG: transcriptional regulator [Dolichospermum sp. LBC05a]
MITGLTIPSSYYLSLITEFAPRPITNDLELSITQQRINTILDQKNLSQDDRDYINVLGMLVYDYEEKNEQFPKLTDGELLQTLMEDYNLEIRDFLGIFEQEQTILDILDGKRQLNSQETFKLRSLIL